MELHSILNKNIPQPTSKKNMERKTYKQRNKKQQRTKQSHKHRKIHRVDKKIKTQKN
jgi:hypothetical protein